MDKLAVQTILSLNLFYHTPLQLKNGTLLLYTNYDTFLFHKNLYPEKVEFKYGEKSVEVSSIMQLKNGTILGFGKDLYIFSIVKSKITISKIIKMPNALKINKLLNVIELKSGLLLAISNNSILKIKLEENIDNNNEVSQIYTIPREWFLEKNENMVYRCQFHQSFNIFGLPNNNILIQSYSIQQNYSRCGRHTGNYYKNKFIILDFQKNNVCYIQSYLNQKVNIIIMGKYICLCYKKYIELYDINNYKYLKDIEIKNDNISKYDENIIIAVNFFEEKNLLIYNLSDINNIRYQAFKLDFISFTYYRRQFCYYFNTPIYKLKNRKLFIMFDDKAYIVEFLRPFDFKSFEK
jgi:hypothetical protein